MAYMISETSYANNIFGKPDTEISVIEELSANKKVWIRNDGNVSVYVRVALIINYQSILNRNDIIPAVGDYEVSLGNNIHNYWYKTGDYYYYKLPLKPGDTTDQFLENIKLLAGKSPPVNYELEVKVLADSIQAEPIDVVKDAWGINP